VTSSLPPPGSSSVATPHRLDGVPGAPVARVALTAAIALAYAIVGLGALWLAGPPGYAAPLYPAAGIGLAAVLVYGAPAWPGVLLGSLVVEVSLGWLRGQSGLALVWLPLTIALGATLQAALGAWLVRRAIGTPVVLDQPRHIALAGLLGAVLACTVSPSVATLALAAAGTLGTDQAAGNWITWWLGDTLGVMIGAPLVLTLIGEPREDWRLRRRTLGLPMLLALALLAAAMAAIDRGHRDTDRAVFEHQVDLLDSELQSRLQRPLYALEAVHGAVLAAQRTDASTLHSAAAWWLHQPWSLRALGYSERVPAAQLAAFEVRARAQGASGFRVFQRDGGTALARDGEAVVLRSIEPLAGNAGALGVNALSIPAARAAILSARDSGEPTASSGFRLTQSDAGSSGIVLYQALYDRVPRNAAERASAFTGVLFVTVDTEALLGGLGRELAADAAHAATGPGAHWCLLDTDGSASPTPLAANAPCRAAGPDNEFSALRKLSFGGRTLELQARSAHVDAALGRPELWPATVAGLVGTALFGALLLTVTGHARRTERAVQAATADLRHEIGERRQAEQALRHSEARLRSILNNTPLGVAFLDPHGVLLDANPRLYEMLGVAAADVRGHAVLGATHEDDRPALAQDHRELLAGRVPVVRRQIRLLRNDGSVLHARVVAGALRDDTARVVHMVAVVEDIEEHLRLEEAERAVARAEAASLAKSEFLSRMSHELRTPLNAMIGFAQLLALDAKPPLSARQQGWARQAQRAGWHLLELINETLDLSRIEAGTVRLSQEPVALAPLVADCSALLATAAAQRRVAFVEDIAPDLPAALADPTRLQQVLTNLLSNAVKYNREGGTVTVRARGDADGGRLLIEVCDSGLGMTESQMSGLFQPYNRLGREASGIEGTGIGLVISRRLAELMGGELGVQSRPGAGSTFTLTLPAAAMGAAVAAAQQPAVEAAAQPPYRQRHVLYVEDNETNVEVMRGVLLQRPQIRLDVVTLGLDALQAARRHRPDLILLDMQLPDISGLELLRHFKKDDDVAAIPVIVVSADATPARMQQALTLGAVHYVTKPLALDEFLAALDEVLGNMDTRWAM